MNSRWAWTIGLPLVAVIYWITLFVATHIPREFHILSRGRDKVAHFFAFALLAILITACVRRWWGLSWSKCLAILAAIAVYGALDEYLQAVLTPPRRADIKDWVMDVAGGLAGILFTAWFFRQRDRSLAAANRQLPE